MWFRYSLIRLGIFAFVFVGLTSAGVIWWLGAVFSTIISFTVSFIFFSNLRDQVSKDLAKRFEKSKEIDSDSAEEDKFFDSENDR